MSYFFRLAAGMRLSKPLRHLRRSVRNFIIGHFGPWLIRFWMMTIRMRWTGLGTACTDASRSRGRIYVLWHQKLLAFVNSHRDSGARILVSAHGDGEMLARVSRRLGFKPVRGSTTRHGVRALKELLGDVGTGCDYGFTPDGPRGPSQILQVGAVYFASKSGLCVVPTTVSYASCWRLPTWDRFVIPRPFTRGISRFGKEFHVPASLDSSGLEECRERLERELRALSDDTEANFEELYAGGVSQRDGLRMQRA